MADEKVYVGDLGTIIEIDMQESLASWSNMTIKIKRASNGSTTTLDGIQKPGDGNGNILQVTTSLVTSVFTVDGLYYVTPYGEVASWKGHGETVQFFVYPIYE